MKTFLYECAAEAIFLSHILIILIICFGWIVPSLYLTHLIVLFGALLSNVYTGSCIFSVWEFRLRKKIHPEIEYDHGYVTHYVQKIFGSQMRDSFMKQLIPLFFACMPFAHLFGILLSKTYA